MFIKKDEYKGCKFTIKQIALLFLIGGLFAIFSIKLFFWGGRRVFVPVHFFMSFHDIMGLCFT